VRGRILDAGKMLSDELPGTISHIEPRKPRYRFAHTIVTRRVVELGSLPQRAPFSRGPAVRVERAAAIGADHHLNEISTDDSAAVVVVTPVVLWQIASHPGIFELFVDQ